MELFSDLLGSLGIIDECPHCRICRVGELVIVGSDKQEVLVSFSEIWLDEKEPFYGGIYSALFGKR